MTLVLGIIRCPEGASPETRSFAAGEATIGRGVDCDWVLADPDRVLSKVHCRVSRRGDGWHVSDTSTNGTFLNHEIERIGHDAARVLREGDRLILGSYEMEVSFAAEALVSLSSLHEPPEQSPFRPWDDDRAGLGLSPEALRLDTAPAQEPHPFGLDGLGSIEDREAAAPTTSDHSPFGGDSFRPPVARTILPDDWDHDDRPAPQAEPMPAPFAAVGDEWPPGNAPAALPPVEPPAFAEPVQPSAPGAVPPVSAPAAPSAPAPSASPRLDANETDDVLAALFAGAAIDPRHTGDPRPLLRSMGAAFRAVVIGLRRIMIARAAIKGEFRIEQTTIRVRGNNPLKFAANDDDALSALMGDARASDMTPEAAVADALRDMRLHELAVASAMQQAVREMLDRLSPERIGRRVPPSALDAWPALRQARLWRAYAAQHAKVSDAFDDDFDSIFGKAFARAYERAIAELAQTAEA